MHQSNGRPVLYKNVAVPREFTACAEHEGRSLRFGGDIRIGDLTGDGSADFLVYRSADGGMKPCFIAAFTMEGDPLWSAGDPSGGQPLRPGSVAVHDVDADGRQEVVCFFHDPDISCPEESLRDVRVQIREGHTGLVKREAAPPEITACAGSGPNWVHHRILLADFRGNGTPQDMVVKLGDRVVALDDTLNVLWTYTIRWNDYGKCAAYIPSVGDIDGDGKDEVNGGYFLLDHDGTPSWESPLGSHMDSVAIAPWDGGRMRALCSGFGHVMDKDGNVVMRLGENTVPHGQEMRCTGPTGLAGLAGLEAGPHMVIRANGHDPHVIVVNVRGDVVSEFHLNSSPNETGMEIVYWYGLDEPALIYNGGMLWDGAGRAVARLPGLSDPVGPPKMGWYHCIPANVCGDDREEVVVYNPWDNFIAVYTPAPFDARCDDNAFQGYAAGPRQYNARIMD